MDFVKDVNDDVILSLPQSIEFSKEIQKFLDKELVIDSAKAKIADKISLELDDEYLEDHLELPSFPQLMVERLAEKIAYKLRDNYAIIGTYYMISRFRDPRKGLTEYNVSYLVSS